MSNAHETFTAILRDGLAVTVEHNGDVLGWFRRNTNQSMDWMIEHEGYSIVTDANLVSGWYAFHQAAGRRGYGVNGALSRLAVAIADTVAQLERAQDMAAGEWRDYVAAPAIVSMLAGFTGLLNHTESGAFECIRGDLHAWARATAARIGEDPDAV